MECCVICERPIDTRIEMNTMNSKPVCDDCYFKNLGKLVEQYPIHSPRSR